MDTVEIKGLLDAQGKALDAAMEKFEGQVAENGKASIEAKAEVKALSEKFDSALTELAQKLEKSHQDSDKPVTAGAEFVKSQEFQDLVAGRANRARIELKNTVTGLDNTVFPQQNAGVIAGNFLPLTIRQVLTSVPVSSNMVNSIREASWTNNAAETSEGVGKPESAITFEPYNVAIQTVPHFIKVSNQLMQDAPAIVAYINVRLRDGLAQRIDKQLLTGNGTGANLSGLTDSGNFTAYTPTSDDNLVDAINRAKYALWAVGKTPDTVIVNPADWGTMERSRENYGSGLGMYLYGAPGQAANVNPFGVQVVLSSNMTQGKFLIGNLRQSAVVYNRAGAVVEMGFENDDFTKNLVTIRAEERLGLGVETPSGILYGSFTA